MGLFAMLGETFGQDRLTLSLALEQTQYQWGELLRGSVEVRGGGADQTLKRLSVRLIEHVDGGKDFSSWHPHAPVQIGQEIAVAAHSVQSFPFGLSLPPAGNPTAEGGVVRFLWSVEAEAAVAQSLGTRTALADFDLHDPPLSDALQALRDALPTVAPLRLRSEARQGARVAFQFAPLPEVSSLLDGVLLTVEESDDAIVGTLQVNPQEQTLADYARSLVHRDRKDHPVCYLSAPLATSRGGPAPPAVLEHLTGLLAPYLSGRQS